MKTPVIVVVLVLVAAGFAWLVISGFEEGGDTDAITTKSGLKYVDVKVGAGAEAKAGDKVTVHYTGRLKDGTQFDSSVGKKPFTFTIDAREVIKGWDEGVAGMKEGGKRKLIIPPELGYGARGSGPIPANAQLIFDVELLKVQ